MPNQFLALLEGAQQTDPKSLVAQINAAFSAVRTLTNDEAIAAYQTLSLLYESTDDRHTRVQITNFQKAIRIRMSELADALQRIDELAGSKLRRRFAEVASSSALQMI